VKHSYYVYMVASKSRVLYIGVTNNLVGRILQHRSGEFGGFTSDYKVHRLVYYEQHAWIQNAIGREKQLKRWRREKKFG
jgi:putative endonuclease